MPASAKKALLTPAPEKTVSLESILQHAIFLLKHGDYFGAYCETRHALFYLKLGKSAAPPPCWRNN